MEGISTASSILRSLNIDLGNTSHGILEEAERDAEAQSREKEIQELLDNGLDDTECDENEIHSDASEESSFNESDQNISHKIGQSEFTANNYLVPLHKEKVSSCYRANSLNEHSLDDPTISHETNNYGYHDHLFNNTENNLKNSHFVSTEQSLISQNNISSYDYNASLNRQDINEKNEQFQELHDEYMKLQILYETRGKDLEQIQKERIELQESSENKIKSLEQKLKHLEETLEERTYNLQQSQELILELQRNEEAYKRTLNSLEFQLSSEKKNRENVEKELEGRKITIQSLEQQINELMCSDNLSRMREQHDMIINDLKKRHNSEIFKLNEDNDDLRKKFDNKVEEIKNLEHKYSQLEKKYEELKIEKCEIIQTLTSNLETSQKQCHHLLQSGAISEVGNLKQKIEQLEMEKQVIEKQKSSLQEEIHLLESELKSYEALYKINKNKISNNSHVTELSSQPINFQNEFEMTLTNLHSQRHLNKSLSSQIEELKKDLLNWKERAEKFEKHTLYLKKKEKELEYQSKQIASELSSRVSLHENQIVSLNTQISDLQKSLEIKDDQIKNLISSEEKLEKINQDLMNKLAMMVKEHSYEIVKAVEKCRQECLELHEKTMNQLNEEYSSKFTDKIQTINADYENKFAKLEQQNKSLNDDLYAAKSDYVKLYEEYNLLHSKLENINKPKDEILKEYEAKINTLEKQLAEKNEKFESHIKIILEKAKEEWVKQKLDEVNKFISQTKQHLNEEFHDSLKKEKEEMQKQIEEEKENLQKRYQNQVNELKQYYEKEKEEILLNSNKMEKKYVEMINKLKQAFEKENQKLIQEFQNKLTILQEELKNYKEKEVHENQLENEKKNLNLIYENEIINLKHQFEEEKANIEQQAKQNEEKKWTEIVKNLEKSHIEEIQKLKYQYDKKALSMQEEFQSNKNESHFQMNEKLNKQKEEFLSQIVAWEKEKSELNHNEFLLKEKISLINEEKKKLNEKVKVYHKQLSHLKKQHQEELNKMSEQISELKKNSTDKSNELKFIKNTYEQTLHMKNNLLKVNSESQTEEQIVSRNVLLNVHDLFLQCLRNIVDEIGNYLHELRKRSAKRLNQVLIYYHNEIITRYLTKNDDLSSSIMHKSNGPSDMLPKSNKVTFPKTSISDFHLTPGAVKSSTLSASAIRKSNKEENENIFKNGSTQNSKYVPTISNEQAFKLNESFDFL